MRKANPIQDLVSASWLSWYPAAFSKSCSLSSTSTARALRSS